MRTIGAVIAGYIIMVICTILGFVITWTILGAEAAFETGTTVASLPWILISFGLGFIAAIVGGCGASKIGGHPSNLPVKLLAGLVVLLGLGLAVAQLGIAPPPLPEGTTVTELSFFEAGQYAVTPTWVNFILPFLGAVGVLLGGSLATRK